MSVINKRSPAAKKKKSKSSGENKSKQNKAKTGPIQDENGIPYNYIVVVDAGSKGTRAYVYNWLSTQFLLANGKLSSDLNSTPRLELVKRVDLDVIITDEISELSKRESDSEEKKNVDLPNIGTQYKWSKKIKPGLSTYENSPREVGPKYLKHLMDYVSKIVPAEQHYRTPIFLHATAGMRLLHPQAQRSILENTCNYFKTQTSFFIPDCDSHVNIIDGDVEGLYGWISLNYLTGTLNNPSDPSNSFGLLEMGGASTQIAFQPSKDSNLSNSNALFKLKLSSLTSKSPDLSFDVFSTSFLGYGLTQAHNKYYLSLDETQESTTDTVLTDPCLPKGLKKKVKIEKQTTSTETAAVAYATPAPEMKMKRYEEDNLNVQAEEEATSGKIVVNKFQVEREVEGSGDFDKCMSIIYPLLVENSACSSDTPQVVSSCLLSESMPSFDFEVNQFYGVSGYWDAMSRLLGLSDDQYGTAYSYGAFSDETAKICNMKWEDIDKLNNDNPSSIFNDLSDEEMSQLCFKSSWVLTVLNKGLGFPLTVGENQEAELNSDSFKVSDKINGSEFTWTLGRAVLYASDESSRDYYNYLNNNRPGLYPKVGYYHASSPGLFIRGSEADGIDGRPIFEFRTDSKDGSTYDEDNADPDDDDNMNFPPSSGSVIFDDDDLVSSSTGSIDNGISGGYGEKPKVKLFASFALVFIFVFVVILMLGGKARLLGIFNEIFLFIKSVVARIRYNLGMGGELRSSGKIHWPLMSRKRYKRLRSLEMPHNYDPETGFIIDIDEEDEMDEDASLTDVQLTQLGIDVGSSEQILNGSNALRDDDSDEDDDAQDLELDEFEADSVQSDDIENYHYESDDDRQNIDD